MKAEDRYQILDKIGSGSFATVYRARDIELGREVAVKQIHQQYLEDPALLDRYWAEAQLLASLQHPNIVTIFDLVRDKGWLVLELMQANLRDRLQGRQMDLKSLRTAIAHCLRALKYLHARGIIHGDVKPSNLMIDSRRRIKIGDFGLARRVSDEEGSLIKGAAKYMAPEVVSDDFGAVGPQSDLYSLGFSAYELMAGSGHFENLFPGLSAFGRDKQAAWMMWHAAPDRRLPEISRVLEGVPDDLTMVIEGLVEKDPEARYKTAEEALSDLNVDLKIVKDGHDGGEVTVEEAAAPANKRRSMAIAAFAGSLLMSLMMLLMPSGGDQGPPTATTIVGIVRSIDPQSKTLVYVDPEEGVPTEFRFTDATRTRLLRIDEQEEFILPKEIQPGFWIEIERGKDAESGEPKTTLVASQPSVREGLIRNVDTAESRVTIGITEGKFRDDLSMFVPTRAEIALNGDDKARLLELRPNDRVRVTYLLDPEGRRGHIVDGIEAWRKQELVAYVAEVDAAENVLTARMNSADGALRTYKLTPETRCYLGSGGQSMQPVDLRPGDYVRIDGDLYASEIIVNRDSERITGAAIALNDSSRVLVLRTDEKGEIMTFQVSADAPVTLGGTPADFEDLRQETDRLTIHYAKDASGKLLATAIDATRPARLDRWVGIISTRL
ncbi:MAG: serine/threonine-protein kinase [Planctomycetaceae bacterium]